jgi:penicillin-binding protein-related factor A (putative recombinase)
MATPEGEIKKSIMQWLEANHRDCYARIIQIAGFRGRKNVSAGVSDIIGVWKGRGLAIEVKAPGEKPMPHQKEFLESWARAGGIAILAYSLDDVIKGLT